MEYVFKNVYISTKRECWYDLSAKNSDKSTQTERERERGLWEGEELKPLYMEVGKVPIAQKNGRY